MKPGLIIGLIVAVALLFGLVIGLSLVLFKNGSGGDSTQIAQQAQQTKPESAPAQESFIPAPQEPVAPIAPPPVANSETSPLEREAMPPVIEELRKAREATEAKAAAEAAAEAKAAEEAAARAAAEPSQKIIDWLTEAQVTGVKLSATNSKVILNGKSYGVGEYVNFALGLKIMIIQEERILFVDKNGQKYMKRL